MTAHAHHAERFSALVSGNTSITLKTALAISIDKDNVILKWPSNLSEDLLITMASLEDLPESASLFLLNDSSVDQTILISGETYIVPTKTGHRVYAFDSDGVRELWFNQLCKPSVV